MKVALLLLVPVAILVACSAAQSKTEDEEVEILQDSTIAKGSLFPAMKNNKWGFLDYKLQWAITPQFDMAEEFTNGFAVVSMRSSEGKMSKGFIDSTGKLVVECRYDAALSFSEGMAVVGLNEKYGFINESGNELIPLEYDDASGFSEGLACVKVKGRNGYINKSGKMVIQPRFSRACWVSDFSEGLAAVYESESGNGGYIDKTGAMILSMQFKHVGKFSGGLALVQPEGSAGFGYINKQGKLVIEPVYDAGVAFSEGLATVKFTNTNGKTVFRVIDGSGKVLADDLWYAFVGIFREGLAGVETFENRWGFIDRTGREVVSPKYGSVRLFHNGLSRVETGSLFAGLHTSYLNKIGKIVWKAQ